ncbi:MAG: metallophosphoesterase [Calditrichaeota bacterium]|nr:MAG: metallophosphoesterase [Calditrichota bacterium]
MRLLIFSDVHANLFALEAMLKAAEKASIDAMLSLGDVVGYNSYPRETLARLQAEGIPSLMGNHEAMICGVLQWNSCKSERGQHAARQTKKWLDNEALATIGAWPHKTEPDAISIAWHAGHMALDRTVNRVEKALPEFDYLQKTGKQIAFFGHTHRPGVFIQDVRDGSVRYEEGTGIISIEKSNRYLINPGTLGEPRHKLPVSYIIYDNEAGICRYHIPDIPAESWKKLKTNNRRAFGVTSLNRLPRQIREKGRHWYYTLGKMKDQVMPTGESKNKAPGV